MIRTVGQAVKAPISDEREGSLSVPQLNKDDSFASKRVPDSR